MSRRRISMTTKKDRTEKTTTERIITETEKEPGSRPTPPRGPFDPPAPASPWHKEQRERTGH